MWPVMVRNKELLGDVFVELVDELRGGVPGFSEAMGWLVKKTAAGVFDGLRVSIVRQF